MELQEEEKPRKAFDILGPARDYSRPLYLRTASLSRALVEQANTLIVALRTYCEIRQINIHLKDLKGA